MGKSWKRLIGVFPLKESSSLLPSSPGESGADRLEHSQVQPIGGVGASGQLSACYRRPSALAPDINAGPCSAPVRSCQGFLSPAAKRKAAD
jgi:hypothetical protein